MINFEISHVHQSYMDEGATLSRTLLPYLNQVTDFSFINEDLHFVVCRFLATLVIHLQDTKEPVHVGFAIFGLHYNPRSL